MKESLVLACALLLAGCMTMSAENCRNADWKMLGYRDGYSASGSMLDQYTAECAPHDVRPDAAAFAIGMESGARDRLYWWGPPGWP